MTDRGLWEWAWFDDSPLGETYGVRRADEVLCYTNRFKAGYEAAAWIATAVNQAEFIKAQAEKLRQAHEESGSPTLREWVEAEARYPRLYRWLSWVNDPFRAPLPWEKPAVGARGESNQP